MKQEYENEPLIRNLGQGFLTRTDFCARYFSFTFFPTKQPSHILPLKSVENRRNKKTTSHTGHVLRKNVSIVLTRDSGI